MKKPRFTYHDTPKGRTRTDSRTGKSQWRPLGKDFPRKKKRMKK